MMNILLGYLEWGYRITDIWKIMLGCLVLTGQVYWLVLMDIQQQIILVGIVLLGVTKLKVSKQQPLSFMEWRHRSDCNSWLMS